MTFGSSRTWFFLFLVLTCMHPEALSLTRISHIHSFITFIILYTFFPRHSFVGVWVLFSFFFSSFVSLPIAAVCVFIAVTSHDS